MEKITFIIPTRNNLEFLKLAYESIRNLKTKHYILVLNDASNDGTEEWLNENVKKDTHLNSFSNLTKERIGIVGMFDKGIEMATTDIIMAFHADMVACEDLDVNILKHLKKGTVVTATRVEPPLHPPGPEKITNNFGVEVEDFKIDNWLKGAELLKQDKQTEGIFAPWCMYKNDFLSIGGHDKLFAPQSKEDSDLFNRFMLKGYKFIQPWDALVYHFTSRGSRFNKNAGGDIGVNSPEWVDTTTRNMRNFIRKWGTVVQHDEFMKPIVSPKYNIAFVIKNCNLRLLEILEPWCSKIYVDDEGGNIIMNYRLKEEPKTILNIMKKVTLLTLWNGKGDIIVRINGKIFKESDYNYIQMLSKIIKDSGEIGKFEIGNLKIQINKLQELQDNLIKIQND